MEDDFLNILICCYFFNGYTGSEMSNYELGRELVRLGHKVSIVSSVVGDPLASKAKRAGIKVYDVNNLPKEKFDILHLNHKPIARVILDNYSDTPAVMHIRSEVIPKFEEPIHNMNIKKYISIRDSITDYLETFGVDRNDVVLIDNPFDYRRFNTNYTKKKKGKKITLFVGTLDHLRKDMIYQTSDRVMNEGGEFWIIGKNSNGYANDLVRYSHVKYFGLQDKVEDFIKQADETVGIFRGRTTIEGWLCGLPAYIYYVDKQGKIESFEYVDVPDDVEKFRADNSVLKVEDLYYDILDELEDE